MENVWQYWAFVNIKGEIIHWYTWKGEVIWYKLEKGDNILSMFIWLYNVYWVQQNKTQQNGDNPIYKWTWYASIIIIIIIIITTTKDK